MEEEKDLTKERDEKCIPIAKELIVYLAEMEKMPLGQEGFNAEEYSPVILKFMQKLIDEEVKAMDVIYIFNLARQALDIVQKAVDHNLDQHMNRVTEHVYGLPEGKAYDVTVADLNRVIEELDKDKKKNDN